MDAETIILNEFVVDSVFGVRQKETLVSLPCDIPRNITLLLVIICIGVYPLTITFVLHVQLARLSVF